MNDDNVFFHWSLAGQDKYNKLQMLFIIISRKVGDDSRVFFCKEHVRAIQAGRENRPIHRGGSVGSEEPPS